MPCPALTLVCMADSSVFIFIESRAIERYAKSTSAAATTSPTNACAQRGRRRASVETTAEAATLWARGGCFLPGAADLEIGVDVGRGLTGRWRAPVARLEGGCRVVLRGGPTDNTKLCIGRG